MQRYPVIWDGDTYEITICVGTVESTVGFMETEHQLIRRARIALDQAKQAGANRTATWSELVETDAAPKDLDRAASEEP